MENVSGKSCRVVDLVGRPTDRPANSSGKGANIWPGASLATRALSLLYIYYYARNRYVSFLRVVLFRASKMSPPRVDRYTILDR